MIPEFGFQDSIFKGKIDPVIMNLESIYRNRLDNFLRSNHLKKVISFSGGSDNEEEKVGRVLEDSISALRYYPVAILTGGTSGVFRN